MREFRFKSQKWLAFQVAFRSTYTLQTHTHTHSAIAAAAAAKSLELKSYNQYLL